MTAKWHTFVLTSTLAVIPAFAQPVEETALPPVTAKEESIDAQRMLRDFDVLPAPTESLATEALLQRRVENIEWTDKPFEEILDWIREQGEGRVNVVPKWGPLGVENVSRESFVTLRLNNTTVADVLNESLEQLSETGDVQYRGVGNKLTITTRQDFERKLYVRIYNVTDILFRVPDFGQDAPKIDLAQQNSGGSGGAGGGGQSIFSGSNSGQTNESDQQNQQLNDVRLGQLRQLIAQTIAPATWDLASLAAPVGGAGGGGTAAVNTAGAGGGQGRIRSYNRSLVVLNTIEVHEQIAGLFSFGG